MRTLCAPALLALPWALLVGCGAPAAREDASTSASSAVTASDAGAAVLTFSASWTQSASGPLVAGAPIAVAYDPARVVPQCGGSATSPGGGGGFAWGITGYYAIGGGAPVEFPVTITGAWAAGNATITPPVAGDLAIWFSCSNTTGNDGWDSAYGANYHFAVGARSGTTAVVFRVVDDAVSGSAGDVPPDLVVTTPVSGAGVYDGPFEAGHLLCTTGSDGTCAAALTHGAHAIDVMKETSDESAIYSSANPLDVTASPGALLVHVVANTVIVHVSYDAGYGNAIYVTGETSWLGNWKTAFKANPVGAEWTYQTTIPVGAQLKVIVAPWVAGNSIPVTAAGVRWEKGSNHVVTTTYGGPSVDVDVTPTF